MGARWAGYSLFTELQNALERPAVNMDALAAGVLGNHAYMHGAAAERMQPSLHTRHVAQGLCSHAPMTVMCSSMSNMHDGNDDSRVVFARFAEPHAYFAGYCAVLAILKRQDATAQDCSGTLLEYAFECHVCTYDPAQQLLL